VITDCNPFGSVSQWKLELCKYIAWHYAIIIRSNEHWIAIADEVFQDEIQRDWISN
jgi:hypothetical protein